jgi:hypothetical protein
VLVERYHQSIYFIHQLAPLLLSSVQLYSQFGSTQAQHNSTKDDISMKMQRKVKTAVQALIIWAFYILLTD